MRKKEKLFSKRAAQLFRYLAQPSRLRILLALGIYEVCVCHLEACLGLRQAYISQQLMGLRQAGLVTSRRDGRNIYYKIVDQSLVPFIVSTSRLIGLCEDDVSLSYGNTILPNCSCPYCLASNPGGSDVPEMDLEDAPR